MATSREVLFPALKAMGEKADREMRVKTKGFEVGYELFCINGRMVGHGEAVRVKRGEPHPVSRPQRECDRD